MASGVEIYCACIGANPQTVLKEWELKELERHNKEVEEHNRLMREEAYRHNREMEIQIKIGESQLREYHTQKQLHNEIVTLLKRVNSMVSDLLLTTFRNKVWGLYSSISASRYPTSHESGSRLLDLAPAAMGYIVSLMYVRDILKKSLNESPLLHEVTSRSETDTMVEIKGITADDFLATKKYNISPKEIISGINLIIDNVFRLPDGCDSPSSLRELKKREHRVVNNTHIESDIPFSGVQFPIGVFSFIDFETGLLEGYFQFSNGKTQMISHEIMGETWNLCKTEANRFYGYRF